MSKNKLKALRALRKKSEIADTGKVDMSDLQDMVLGSMANTIKRYGDLSEDMYGDWRTHEKEILPGVKIAVRTPAIPLVEIDGMTVFESLYESASTVTGHVLTYFASKPQDQFSMWLEEHDTGNAAMDATVKVLHMVMEIQGWKNVRGKHWMSPAWLMPPMNIPVSAVRAFVEENFEYKALVEKEAPAPEAVDLIADEVLDG